jgi:hypothetical protein
VKQLFPQTRGRKFSFGTIKLGQFRTQENKIEIGFNLRNTSKAVKQVRNDKNTGTHHGITKVELSTSKEPSSDKKMTFCERKRP